MSRTRLESELPPQQVQRPAQVGGRPRDPGAPQDEAGLTRKFETSHVGGATGRTPPIPRSALEKDPRPGPLFACRGEKVQRHS